MKSDGFDNPMDLEDDNVAVKHASSLFQCIRVLHSLFRWTILVKKHVLKISVFVLHLVPVLAHKSMRNA